MGYQGHQFLLKIHTHFDKKLEIVKRPSTYHWVPNELTDVTAYLNRLGHKVTQGFQVQPKRWIVERTFAWLGKYRRLSKDYEFKISHSEHFI